MALVMFMIINQKFSICSPDFLCINFFHLIIVYFYIFQSIFVCIFIYLLYNQMLSKFLHLSENIVVSYGDGKSVHVSSFHNGSARTTRSFMSMLFSIDC
jgi:hypothetical protein